MEAFRLLFRISNFLDLIQLYTLIVGLNCFKWELYGFLSFSDSDTI